MLILQNKSSTKNSHIGPFISNHRNHFNFSTPIIENCNNEGTKHYEENKLTFEKLDVSTINEIPNTTRISRTKSISVDENGKTSDEKDLNLAAFKPIKTKELNYMKRKVNRNLKRKKNVKIAL
jgi:hypothetical protein